MLHQFFATIFHKLIDAKSENPVVIVAAALVLLILMVALLVPLFFSN